MATQSRDAEGAVPDRESLLMSLVSELSDPNGRRRQKAREALVDMGRVAVPVLLEALESREQRLRWEAAKALGEIADASAIDALLTAMLDEKPEIRWLAAEALAAIGWPAAEPLLHALIKLSHRTVFRLGAHYVLRSIEDRGTSGILQPVLDALQGVSPAMETPIAAQEALIKIMNERFRAA